MRAPFFLLHRFALVAVSAVVVAAPLALVGCSTSDVASASRDGGEEDDASGQGEGGEADARTSDAADARAGDTRCQSLSRAACHECCKLAHEPALYLIQAATLACVCKPENCQVACNDTWCANPVVDTASPACASCVGVIEDAGSNGPCSPALKAACNADDDCAAMTRCIHACDATDAGK